jgi:hypothetical protein
MTDLHLIGCRGSDALEEIEFLNTQVRPCRWESAKVSGINPAHARSQVFEHYGWAPLIRLKDTREVIWHRRKRIAKRLR